jgi:hypothetical protein
MMTNFLDNVGPNRNKFEIKTMVLKPQAKMIQVPPYYYELTVDNPRFMFLRYYATDGSYLCIRIAWEYIMSYTTHKLF